MAETNELLRAIQLLRQHLLNTKVGVAVGAQQTIIRTTDGAVTWNAVTPVLEKPIALAGTTNYLADFKKRILQLPWERMVLFSNLKISVRHGRKSIGTSENTLMAITAIDQMNATAVGNGGVILRTSDAGATWITQLSTTTRPLFRSCFTSSDTGIIVGDYGIMLKTTNGGITWIKQPSGTINHLRDIAFIDNKTGISVGAMGTIIGTSDGGMTWTLQESGTCKLAKCCSASL